MKRWGIITKTRKARKKLESKNLAIRYANIVNRNFNPIKNNIIATDVIYILANEKQNNVYLSIAINHKTKFIESHQLSKENNQQLVLETYKKINRHNIIIHSDHGSQYSTKWVAKFTKENNWKILMSKISNSLDNQEAEYFFSYLKGDFLKFKRTHKLKFNQIKESCNEYNV